MAQYSVFLSRFWVSKWHPKILQWHPKLWKPRRYGFALYWSKTIEKTCFPACDYCNTGCNDRPTQFSGSEAGSGNCKNSICALSCAPLRFGLLLCFRRFVKCTKMWKNF